MCYQATDNVRKQVLKDIVLFMAELAECNREVFVKLNSKQWVLNDVLEKVYQSFVVDADLLRMSIAQLDDVGSNQAHNSPMQNESRGIILPPLAGESSMRTPLSSDTVKRKGHTIDMEKYKKTLSDVSTDELIKWYIDDLARIFLRCELSCEDIEESFKEFGKFLRHVKMRAI